MALNPDRLENIKRLKDAGDISNSLKELKPTLNRIINICKDINYDDIVYSYKNNIAKIFCIILKSVPFSSKLVALECLKV